MTELDGPERFLGDPDADDEVGNGEDPLAGRTDLDSFGSDPDVRFPGTSEDPTMSTADATANAIHPEPEGDAA